MCLEEAVSCDAVMRPNAGLAELLHGCAGSEIIIGRAFLGAKGLANGARSLRIRLLITSSGK